MGISTIWGGGGFENPRRGRQARNLATNCRWVPLIYIKRLRLEREQITAGNITGLGTIDL